MSTDGSISEVSSSGNLSHCHASPDCDRGKESETSLVSSEGTSASGPVRPATGRIHNSQTPGGIVDSRPLDTTPACDKIRSLCLSTEETFGPGKNLPFINPSSLETLRSLVQGIQSNGETDPEMWKDCEGRWLHLFQLVEKQYQEQILAQQGQYQCQIQLIQDEIKALVQLQHRQNSGSANIEFSSTPLSTTYPTSPLMPNQPSPLADLSHRNASQSAPAPIGQIPTSTSPPPQQPEEGIERQAVTALSSGYGTLSAWETGTDQTDSPRGRKTGKVKEECHWPPKQENTETTLRCQHSFSNKTSRVEVPIPHQRTSSGSNQPLTNWAQRQKLRPKRSKAEQASIQTTSRESPSDCPLETTDLQDQRGSSGLLSNSLLIRRSDSLVSEASGLTYWRLDESDLYCPLPDSFDSGAYLLMKEVSMSLASSEEPRVNLKEFYLNKLKTDSKSNDWDGLLTSSQLSPQVLTLDPTVNKRQSDRTSGFTSPSHFSSPSYPTQTHQYSHMGMPASSDSIAEDRPCVDRASSLEDPVVLSLLRQNLREKHSRHVADLKAYYEAEIRTLREQLNLHHLPHNLEKSNCALQERCDHLERALTEASRRIQELETKNTLLDRKLVDWTKRYEVAGATVTALRQRLEESKRSGSEKDALHSRLRIRIQQLEEELHAACKGADEKEAKRKREYKMLQDLLGEYDGLRKDLEAVKDKLVSKENKLVSANEEISELKRVIFKLESQVKQLEHENKARARYAPHSHSQPSGAGLYHHPDLLISPSKRRPEPETTYRNAHYPQMDQSNGCRPFPFAQMDHLKGCSLSPRTQTDQSTGTGGGSVKSTLGEDNRRLSCPPEHEQCPPDHQHLEQAKGLRDEPCPLTPMMRALIELEETRATESRAPCKNSSAPHRLASRKNTLAFVKKSPKELVQEGGRISLDCAVAGIDRTRPATATRHLTGASERAAAVLRAQRSLSPEGHRSSSLPPPAHRTFPPTTPTKRETLLAPLSAKSSPKRCPTENFSTAFDLLISRPQNLHNKFDMPIDQRQHSCQSSSPRKRLHLTEKDRQEVSQHSDKLSANSPSSANPAGTGLWLGWEEQGAGGKGQDLQDTVAEAAPSLQARLHSLADSEKLFDDLTQEKQQIEAALSRIPRAGGRVNLQTRLDEVALENRLERVNRDLGSIRMTLKTFHVLRSSVNI
ncbi:M-phase phosphoprotein 9 [Aplochiton taeniatus]